MDSIKPMGDLGWTDQSRDDHWSHELELLDSGCCLERKGTSTTVAVTVSEFPMITVSPSEAAFLLI